MLCFLALKAAWLPASTPFMPIPEPVDLAANRLLKRLRNDNYFQLGLKRGYFLKRLLRTLHNKY
jgi:hypothetical protein